MSHLRVTLLILLVAAISDCRRVIRAVPESNKTGCYIVKLEDDTNHDRFEELTEKLREESIDHHIYEKAEGSASKIITVKLPEVALDRIKHLDNVELLEEETFATAAEIQSNAPWHLDILDQEPTILNQQYNPIGDGDGVDIYILDTGVNYDHEEFEGRAEYPGFDPVDSATGSNQQGWDCHGHGTHVASLAAGRVYGAAKKARIYSVRVLNCYGGTPWSIIISGINYAVQKATKTGRPSVISMSLIGYYSYSVNMATSNAVNGNEILGIPGVPVVVAAGNSQRSSCLFSPASTPAAITVGGSASQNQLYAYTNGGPCVDIFAPGAFIHAASHSCTVCYKYRSGTSMATPLVSGAVAIMLGRQPQLTPAEVHRLVIDHSIKDALDFTTLLVSNTQNRLLHITAIQCNVPSDPYNGTVNTTGREVGDTATYSCDNGYKLRGSSTVTCRSNGYWSEPLPICEAIINCSTPSNQPNGVVTVSGTLLGSIAQYNCNDGYVLVGDATRTCENTGHWSGTEPVCNRPIEVDLVVEANSITGTITCHDNASAIDSLSCEVRRMSGKVDKPMIPCACDSSFTFNGLTAGKHRVLVVTGADGSKTETNFYTCYKTASSFCSAYIKDYSIDEKNLRVSFGAACDTTKFRCFLRGQGWSDCTSPVKYSVTPGKLAFRVQPLRHGNNMYNSDVRLKFEVAPNGTMIDSSINYQPIQMFSY